MFKISHLMLKITCWIAVIQGHANLEDSLLFNVEKESSHYSCTVQGEVPSWLSGTLLRNGPAQFSIGETRVKCWFDGLAMVHAFTVTPQEIFYTNRFLRSLQYQKMHVEGNLNFNGFSQSCASSEEEGLSNALVNIAQYANQVVALTEYPLPVAFDKETLDTLGSFDYEDEFPKRDVFESAHPQTDTETINYLTCFGEKSFYLIWKMGQEGRRELIGKIPVEMPSYMHSFALTEKYIVLVEYPFVVNPIDLVTSGKPFIENFQWQPERKTHFLVIERNTGDLVATLVGESCFSFHHVNAFDREEEIVIDTVIYDNASIIGKITDDTPSGHGKLVRFTLNTAKQQVQQATLFEQALEMPTVSPALTARPYRFCYAVDYRFPDKSDTKRPLYKIDTQTRDHLSWQEEGCFPGEPLFVAHPSAKTEDEGVILSLVLNYKQHRSFLLILDAKDLHELARVEAPYAIPAGLHGLFVRD